MATTAKHAKASKTHNVRKSTVHITMVTVSVIFSICISFVSDAVILHILTMVPSLPIMIQEIVDRIKFGE